MRPVVSLPPLCALRELQDGTYTLTDVLLMNQALDVRDENEQRARAAAEAKNRRR